MKYLNVVEGKFVKRINRFLAKVLINDLCEFAAIKNTGRCKELLIEGVLVYLEKSDNFKRKTKYSLIAVKKKSNIINIDSQVPNLVVYESLLNSKIKNIKPNIIKREIKYRTSRFDIYFEYNNKKCFMEVKGVTLENNRVSMFPDAPTIRGQRHIKELIEAKEEGYETYLLFLVQMDYVDKFICNIETDCKFCNMLRLAHNKGVNILVYNSKVKRDGIDIGTELRFSL